MFTQFFTLIIFTLILFQNCNNCVSYDLDDVYLHLFGQIENIKKSLEIVNTRLDIMVDRHGSNNNNKNECQDEKLKEIPLRKSNVMFDIRYDKLPKNCHTSSKPSSCKEATICTRSSGIYNITDTLYRNNTFLVYCDYENYDGDWLYILNINDGTENFNRPWNDYVKGFGNVAGEYWLGLENLYALTNFYGPQELNVHLEDFQKNKAYARYENFVVGSPNEKYKLKSLGRYFGTAGDSLYNKVGSEFSTYDNDNDNNADKNCALNGGGGFWFNNCSLSNPTGRYLRGKFMSNFYGSFWQTFKGDLYSPKTIIFMIRRKAAFNIQHY